MSSYSESRARARDRMQTAAREIEKLKGKIAELRNQKMSDKEKKAFSLQKLFQKSATPYREVAAKVRFFTQRISSLYFILKRKASSFLFVGVFSSLSPLYLRRNAMSLRTPSLKPLDDENKQHRAHIHRARFRNVVKL